MIDTVIFDLGKVLVDFHPIQAMERLGFSKEAIDTLSREIFSGLWESCDEKPMSQDYIRKLFKERVPGYEREIDDLWDNITFLTEVYDYSYKWIEDLKKRGFKVYILSNFGQEAFHIFSKMYDFLSLVDGKVISYEVCVTKPDRRIYELLCTKYSIVPQNAVFIDDRQANIDGAIDYGMQGILFADYKTVSDTLDKMLQ